MAKPSSYLTPDIPKLHIVGAYHALMDSKDTHTSETTGSTNDVAKLDLPIAGMTCAACATRIERKLGKEPGVDHSTVNYATEGATVEYHPGTVELGRIVEAVGEAGYAVRTDEITVQNSHQSEVERHLSGISGIVSISREGDTTKVTYLSGKARGERIRQALSMMSVTAEEVESGDEGGIFSEQHARDLYRRFVAAALLSLPVVVVSMAHGVLDFAGSRWWLMALSTPVVFWAGRGFFTGAWNAARHGAADMNTLVAMGAGSAYIYSIIATVWPDLLSTSGETPAIYFEAAAVIVTLILLGRYFEARAKGKTGQAIKSLLKLQPPTATVILPDGKTEEERGVDDIDVGTLLRIRPGESIPLDAVVVNGSSSIDESMLTGEPMPVDKETGSSVFAGTLNTTGALVVRVTGNVQNSTLQKIVETVRQAQSSKAPVQRLADTVAGYFVPVVIVIAVAAGVVWYFAGPEPRITHAMIRFVTVLIISCPCALGLATPTAIMVATGKAARKGILIAEGAALETGSKIDIVVLDKTGTVTAGRPEVISVHSYGEHSTGEILQLAASVEQSSEHIIASAIVSEAKKRGLSLHQVTDFQSFAGFGVSAAVNGNLIRAGKRSFVKEVTDRSDHDPIDEQETGTSVYITRDNTVLGHIILRDIPKVDAQDSVGRLREMSLETVLLTGDNVAAGNEIADEVGIGTVVAGVLPDEKAAKVREWRAAGRKVAMVGDGINDAPALAAADVGIAIGAGTDIAIQASDVTLMRDDLSVVVDFFDVSRATMKTIKENLFFAFIYNIVLIPVAAGLLYPLNGLLLSPVLASAAMALSSVSVVANSLRLK